MDRFSKRVDLELLDRDFLKTLTGLFEAKLRQPLTKNSSSVAHNSVPSSLINFERYMDLLKESSCYEKLITCLSSWMALMELCDDLLERMQLYGHAQYLDIKHA